MESLNSYVSDGDSSPERMMPTNHGFRMNQEADADCEPVTMDMSEDEKSSPPRDDEKNAGSTHRRYSRELSPSPPTSTDNEKSDEDRKRRDDRDDRDRRHVKKESRKYSDDRHSNRKKHSHRSRSRSRSRDRSRSRGSHHKRHRSSKHKYRSRSRSKSGDRRRRRSSRSRSRDRHHGSSSRRSHYRTRSPYKPKRSRSRSHSRDIKSRPYDWKCSKLKVLEKLGIELKVPPGGIEVTPTGVVSSAQAASLTPQLLLRKTMEMEVAKVKCETGIALPDYYNPVAVNPCKYAEQMKKRQMLWKKDKGETPKTENPEVKQEETAPSEHTGSGTIWKGATFGGDQGGKMTAKFKRLMGIKDAGDATDDKKDCTVDINKKQEEMFSSMESQYEVARLATHSHRGLGLGFGTFQPK